jgi:LPXTG-motif cell wall-anchored protein
LGKDNPSQVPLGLPAGVTVTAVAAGGNRSLALTSVGTVLTWVGNGLGKDNPSQVPLGLPAGVTVTAIAAGGNHSLALALRGSTTTLPVTGASLPPTLIAGFSLLLVGATLIHTSRRRRPVQPVTT